MKKKRVIQLASATAMAVLSCGVVFAGVMVKDANGKAAAPVSGVPVDIVSYPVDAYGIKGVETLEDGGYVVRATGKGFNPDVEIELAVVFNETGDQVQKLEVVSQSETEGLGSKIATEDFLAQFNGISAPVMIQGMKIKPVVVEEEKEDTSAKEETAAKTLTDGTYTATTGNYENGGYRDDVTLVVEGGKITSVTYECVNESGDTKSVQSINGEYLMTEDGPTWAEQAKAIADYIVANQNADIKMDEAGKTDAIAGVSISISNCVELVKQCLEQAAKPELKDGTYTAEAAEFDDSGYKSIVTMTVKDGAITSLNWDNKMEDGTLKSVQAANGEYTMTEDGLTWAEQSEAISKKVIEDQGLNGIILGDNGKTDAVAGVSISVNDFVTLTKDCISQASGSAGGKDAKKSEEKKETPAIEGTKFDAIAGATISSKAIATIINHAYFFLQDCILK